MKVHSRCCHFCPGYFSLCLKTSLSKLTVHQNFVVGMHLALLMAVIKKISVILMETESNSYTFNGCTCNTKISVILMETDVPPTCTLYTYMYKLNIQSNLMNTNQPEVDYYSGTNPCHIRIMQADRLFIEGHDRGIILWVLLKWYL